MSFYERAADIIRGGCPLSKITQLSCREQIMRIKTTYANDDTTGILEVENAMNQQLDELDRLYRKAGVV